MDQNELDVIFEAMKDYRSGLRIANDFELTFNHNMALTRVKDSNMFYTHLGFRPEFQIQLVDSFKRFLIEKYDLEINIILGDSNEYNAT